MRNGLWQYKSLRTMILAATPLFCLSIPASGQQAPDQDSGRGVVQGQTDMNRGQDASENRNQNGDANREQNGVNHGDLVVFDRFLDSHPEIAEQLRKNPSLIEDRRWVQDHPALQTFLHDHSQLRGAITSNPTAFMRAERRYDFREDARGGDQNAPRDAYNGNSANRDTGMRDRDANTSNRDTDTRDRDTNRGQNTDVDRDHDQNGSVNRDRINRGDLAEFDHFLDRHHEIAEQLRRNPSLIDNRQFIESHPALQTFLRDHSQLSGAIASNPNAFMQAENRYDAAEDRRGGVDESRNFDRDHLASFNAFMGRHQDIARDVSQNPDRVNDDRYVANHAELKQYLNSNPGVRQDLSSNPQSFVKVAQQVNVNGTGTSSSTSGSTSGSASGSGSSTGTSTGRSGAANGTGTTNKPTK